MFRGGEISWPCYRFLSRYMENARALEKLDMIEALDAAITSLSDGDAAKKAVKGLYDALYESR